MLMYAKLMVELFMKELQVRKLVELEEEERQAILDLQRLNIPKYFAWVLYDVANSFYASSVLTIVSFTWILVIGQQNNYSYAMANLIYTWVLAGASIFMALMLPILGAISDVTNQRKWYVVFFTLVSVLSTIGFIVSHDFLIVLFMLALSIVTYQWAQVFYDAMLPGIVPQGKEARYSSIAIALGYIGGGVVTGIGFLLSKGNNTPISDPALGQLSLGYYPVLVIIAIIGYGLLSIPMIFVREVNWEYFYTIVEGGKILDEISVKPIQESKFELWQVVKASFHELKRTLLHVYYYNKGLFYYIIAFFIIADFANLAVVVNVPFMRDGLGLSDTEIYYVIGVSGASLITFTYFIGLICDRKGAKVGFQVVGALWFFALLLILLEGIVFPRKVIYLAAIFLGPGLSGIWVSQRQMVLELAPSEEEIGQYFGLTKFSGKLSSALGPFVWGTTFFFFKNKLKFSISMTYRVTMFTLALFLAIGFLILQKVPNKHEEFKKRREETVKKLAQIYV